jgi:hypothetical protein
LRAAKAGATIHHVRQLWLYHPRVTIFWGSNRSRTPSFLFGRLFFHTTTKRLSEGDQGNVHDKDEEGARVDRGQWRRPRPPCHPTWRELVGSSVLLPWLIPAKSSPGEVESDSSSLKGSLSEWFATEIWWSVPSAHSAQRIRGNLGIRFQTHWELRHEFSQHDFPRDGLDKHPEMRFEVRERTSYGLDT